MVALAGPGPAHLRSLPQRVPSARLAVRHPKARRPGLPAGGPPAFGLLAQSCCSPGQVLPTGGWGSLLPGPRVGTSVPDYQDSKRPQPRDQSVEGSGWGWFQGVGETTHRTELPLSQCSGTLKAFTSGYTFVQPWVLLGHQWRMGEGPHEGQGRICSPHPPHQGP